MPNAGLIDELPEWLAVEVPATVDADGVHGVPLGQLPKGFLGLLRNQVAVHDLTAEAVISGSKEAVLQALRPGPPRTSRRRCPRGSPCRHTTGTHPLAPWARREPELLH